MKLQSSSWLYRFRFMPTEVIKTTTTSFSTLSKGFDKAILSVIMEKKAMYEKVESLIKCKLNGTEKISQKQ